MGVFGGDEVDAQFQTGIDVPFNLSGRTGNGLSFGAEVDHGGGLEAVIGYGRINVIAANSTVGMGWFDGFRRDAGFRPNEGATRSSWLGLGMSF